MYTMRGIIHLQSVLFSMSEYLRDTQPTPDRRPDVGHICGNSIKEMVQGLSGDDAELTGVAKAATKQYVRQRPIPRGDRAPWLAGLLVAVGTAIAGCEEAQPRPDVIDASVRDLQGLLRGGRVTSAELAIRQERDLRRLHRRIEEFPVAELAVQIARDHVALQEDYHYRPFTGEMARASAQMVYAEVQNRAFVEVSRIIEEEDLYISSLRSAEGEYSLTSRLCNGIIRELRAGDPSMTADYQRLRRGIIDALVGELNRSLDALQEQRLARSANDARL